MFINKVTRLNHISAVIEGGMTIEWKRAYGVYDKMISTIYIIYLMMTLSTGRKVDPESMPLTLKRKPGVNLIPSLTCAVFP